MGETPFGTRRSPQRLLTGRRRSTRIEFITRVILSGRDASGKPFREETETSIVNLHGAKLRTQHQVLVGMQVEIECPGTGIADKAICVQVGEPGPEGTARDIAIQLIRPQNLWGMENPPADWRVVEADLGRAATADKRAGQAPSLAPSEAESSPAPTTARSTEWRLSEVEQRLGAIVESSRQSLSEQAAQVVTNAVEQLGVRLKQIADGAEMQLRESVEKAYADVDSFLGQTLSGQAGEIVDVALRQLEERLKAPLDRVEAQVSQRVEKAFAEVDTFLGQTMSKQAEEIVAVALRQLEERLKAPLDRAETQISQRVEKVQADFGSYLEALRVETADQLRALTQGMLDSAEEELRLKISELFAGLAHHSSRTSPAKTSEPRPEK